MDEETRAYLDDMRRDFGSRFDGVDSRLGVLEEKGDRLDHRFDVLDQRVDGLDSRLGALEQKVDGLDHRLGVVEQKVDGLDSRLGALEQKVDGLDHRLGVVEQKVDGLDHRLGALEQKVDGLDSRVGVLEQKVDRLDRRVAEEARESRQHFDVTGEALRQDIRTLAEVVFAQTEAIDRFRTDIGREIDERFRASDAVMRVAFADVRRHIDDLRARL
ncbi:MAG: hypothetical protein HY727_19940 [Candidatus Rokubacteria bacterium]|nr:hypothetical protein [Candidatus Rokubacteria bacterium]